MRVGIVINTSWNLINFRQGLMKALIDEGYQVYAIAPKDDYSAQLAELGVEFVPLQMQAKSQNPWQDYQLIQTLKSIYRKLNLDFVLQYTIKPNIYGTLAARSLPTKVINNVSGLGTTFIRESWVTKLVKGLYRKSFKHADHVFFQNPEDQTLFKEAKLVPIHRTSLLPGSGIDTQQFKFEPKEATPCFKFLMPARLLIDKGIEEYIGAATKMKQTYGDLVEFRICGKPENNPKIGWSAHQIKPYVEQGIVHYLGHVDDMPQQMAQVDVIVLPSYREGTPRCLLEAASMGRFMITTDVPGCRQVVVHQHTGLLARAKEVDSLYHCMEEYMGMSVGQRKTLVLNARNRVQEKFEESIVVGEYLKKIKELS